MSASVELLSLSTALPPHVLLQRDAAMAAHEAFADRFSDFSRLERVFANAQITSRRTVKPLEWYLAPLGWTERNVAYLEGAANLFVDAATRALAAAQIDGTRVDAVVTASTTGIATPSLDALTAERVGLRPDVERVPMFGLGCAGGVAGLAVAASMARSRPGRVVLFVAVETCSLSFRLDKLTKENIVATALFGDGAAACVLCAGEAGAGRGLATVEASGQHTWPDTLGVMGWSVDPEGLGVIFDRAIPPFAEAHLADAAEGVLQRAGLGFADVDRFTCHPGGAKVIRALERSLSLAEGALDHEREVLRDHGNMSAPTVLFVLERSIAAGLPPRSVLTALGPGFTLNCVSLRRPS